MSVKYIHAVWESSCPDAQTLVLLLALADWCNDDGECWPSIPQLAKKSRQKDRNCQLHLRRLEMLGVLTCTPGGGRGKPNLYTIDLEKMQSVQWVQLSLHPLQGFRGKETVQSEEIKGATLTCARGLGGSIKEPSEEKPPIVPQGTPKHSKQKLPTNYTPGFLDAWNRYPQSRRSSKPLCFRAWLDANLETRSPTIASIVETMARGPWRQTEPKFIPLFSTWLNQGRYEDIDASAPQEPSFRQPFRVEL